MGMEVDGKPRIHYSSGCSCNQPHVRMTWDDLKVERKAKTLVARVAVFKMMKWESSLTIKGEWRPDDQVLCQAKMYGREKGEENGKNDKTKKKGSKRPNDAAQKRDRFTDA